MLLTKFEFAAMRNKFVICCAPSTATNVQVSFYQRNYQPVSVPADSLNIGAALTLTADLTPFTQADLVTMQSAFDTLDLGAKFEMQSLVFTQTRILNMQRVYKYGIIARFVR